MDFDVIGQFGRSEPLGKAIVDALCDTRWTQMDAAVAFVKMSGVRHIAQALDEFSRRTKGNVRISVGIDHQGSTIEGVQLIWQILADYGGKLFVVHNPQGRVSPTFHPKTWVFRDNAGNGRIIVGSGNLTQGGLYTNYELGIALDAKSDDIYELCQVLQLWSDQHQPDVSLVDSSVLSTLYENGDLPSEVDLRRAQRAVQVVRSGLTQAGTQLQKVAALFPGRSVPLVPPAADVPTPQSEPAVVVQPMSRTSQSTNVRATSQGPPLLSVHSTLYMTINPGKKTEIYLSKGARNDDPAFFGWPFTGLTDPKRKNNPPQPQASPQPIVDIIVYSQQGMLETKGHLLKMWVYAMGKSANDDFRITLPSELHKAVSDGCIMVMERNPPGTSLDFRISFYHGKHPSYKSLERQCTQTIPNSSRKYGWS